MGMACAFGVALVTTSCAAQSLTNRVKGKTMAADEPTPTLEAFRNQYDDDDNVFWYLSSGDHLNLLEEALDRLAELEAVLTAARAYVNMEPGIQFADLLRAVQEADNGNK